MERARGSLRREDIHEFRVGRIKHERVKVPRGDQLLEWAMQVMKVHADRKASKSAVCLLFDHEFTLVVIRIYIFVRSLCKFYSVDYEHDEIR